MFVAVGGRLVNVEVNAGVDVLAWVVAVALGIELV